MDRKYKSEVIHDIMTKYEKDLNEEEFLDVLAFLSVVVLHNIQAKSPTVMLDRVVHYWVKTMTVLAQSFTVRPPNGKPPEA